MKNAKLLPGGRPKFENWESNLKRVSFEILLPLKFLPLKKTLYISEPLVSSLCSKAEDTSLSFALKP